MNLNEVCVYGKEKVESSNIEKKYYVSTDNMLPNFGGTTSVCSFPENQKVIKYKKDDILISNIRPYFKKMIIAQNDGGCSADVLVLKPKENIISKFLFYYLMTDEFFDYVVSTSKGTKMPRGDKEAIMKYDIEIPDKTVQHKIVTILDGISNKIELNTKINDNLFNLGLTFYKEWFSSLADNEETTYKEIAELGQIVMGQSPKGESYNNNNIGLPLINGAADYENGYLKPQKYTSIPTKICKKNDLIFCIRATIGLLTICDREYCLGRGVASITNITDNYKEYAFYLIHNSIEQFKRLATGSVIVGISRDEIGSIKVKIPTEEQIKYFHKVQKPIFEKIENIRRENKYLVNLRDILLPKLMNGEIDLDKIEI